MLLHGEEALPRPAATPDMPALISPIVIARKLRLSDVAQLKEAAGNLVAVQIDEAVAVHGVGGGDRAGAACLA